MRTRTFCNRSRVGRSITGGPADGCRPLASASRDGVRRVGLACSTRRWMTRRAMMALAAAVCRSRVIEYWGQVSCGRFADKAHSETGHTHQRGGGERPVLASIVCDTWEVLEELEMGQRENHTAEGTVFNCLEPRIYLLDEIISERLFHRRVEDHPTLRPVDAEHHDLTT